ncbi:hypothetical protein OIE62_16395 [Streptomyces scopuliridis]|uniref:Uncharacterized protein n=1 Tax=Streptomyces scopuliridis TaxID=452529 RepID=A0ACD4ZNU5_9ACTN|nr:hypothetical protein [Streptomyces scopuliridis]WSB35643.1 hypothetical protein OG949_24220 [Streptomyces scopuliridis]WSB99855.1 hypothetical protein OG835_24560 [Streptomyces scopuliridis]WSC06446.1 hypothetical protein OIE62_16395 [Streptomyces scopuliridis]
MHPGTHSDTHLRLHALRAAELRHEAAAFRLRPPRANLRTRLGWSLVELGLRLVNRPVASGRRLVRPYAA